ncbi:MAG TPA: glycosyltransferase family 1 protein [Candidatus Acidoferrum sp.]|jgi:glycosyltransferase involved in cell wall biosynthesis|nr:glycosyltransferase family 1 protein [Candidatus Acidoferrum sp.]
MKVALDAQLCVGTATGIGEYVAGLSRALRRQQLNVVELREPLLDPWRFDRRVLWDQVVLPLRAGASGADLLHCASGTMPLFAGMPIVVTVHDVAWLHVQAHARPYARYYFGRFSLERYRHAAGIIVDSSFSRDALVEVLTGIDRAAVRVVYPGVAREFCDVARIGGDGRTILAVGTVERRKNLELLIRVLPQLNGARIVCVGPQTPYARECEELAGRLGVAGRLELRGYVPREELIALYREAAVVAVPSRYEGFGYAAAQALCAGVPCVVSDRTSLPEIVGNDGGIASIDDAAAWTSMLEAALRGDWESRASRVRAGAVARFSWDASAGEVKRVYEAICGKV